MERFDTLCRITKISHRDDFSLQLGKNDYTCIEIAIFAIANRKGIQ